MNGDKKLKNGIVLESDAFYIDADGRTVRYTADKGLSTHDMPLVVWESLPDEDPNLFNPLMDALVEIAIETGEDWSSYVADRTGTEEDLRKSEHFRKDIREDPRLVLDQVRRLRQESEEG